VERGGEEIVYEVVWHCVVKRDVLFEYIYTREEIMLLLDLSLICLQSGRRQNYPLIFLHNKNLIHSSMSLNSVLVTKCKGVFLTRSLIRLEIHEHH